MKRLLVIALVLALLLPSTNVLANNDDVKIYIDDKLLNAKGIIVNGSTLVPLRAIFEAIGASVTWDDKTKTVTSTKKDITIELIIGEKKAKKNDVEIDLAVPGKIINGSTYVPLRFIGEAFGDKVDWDETTKSAKLTINLDEKLYKAVQKNDLIKVAYLLEAGANPNQINEFGTPLLYIQPRNYEMVKLLLEYGADPNIKGSRESSILLRASTYAYGYYDTGEKRVYCPDIDLVRLLIKYGADVSTVLPDLLIQQKIDLEVVELLLQSGADPNGKTIDGTSFINRAKLFKNYELVDLLRAYGAK